MQSFVENPGNLLSVGGGILAVGSGILSGLTGVLIVLILMLYFLASMRGMKRAAYRFVPASRRENFIDVSEQITQAVGRYVVGQVSQALINGILSLVFLLIIGAPLPVLLAFVRVPRVAHPARRHPGRRDRDLAALPLRVARHRPRSRRSTTSSTCRSRPT